MKMPLSTEGLLEELQRFRRDKLALVALVGCMDAESEEGALIRLREIIALTEEHLVEARSANRGRLGRKDQLARDVLELASEIEPWLAKVAEKDA
jgi:hypothetical protein